ncbi:MAG: family 10 glycosylhydrolase [Candidatus Latescibacteria bacterium]|jgi:hypothetical protein|nr:family 10 glycosylhydrolase [Candidatus Latescibacterota bacterium]MBT4137065.1 family 10 glycosylhydrolase [Candidatus Latescibacterota bacterium]MBT5832926.1 family 10 glycosylhydrolase [Candidatus Latescibacterota bacterium]
MKDRLVICNDDGIQMLHHCVPGQVETSVQQWVDFFLLECGVDVFAFCTARPDKTHHETQVGERDYDFMELAPAQAQLHYKEVLDELRDQGTDILKVVTDRVHHHGRRVMASVRMSDVHHASEMYRSLTPKIMLDHPEWRIVQDDGHVDVALDYTFEGVREHRLAILEEIVTNYDVDGLELDFMRSCRYFPAHLAEERIPIMTAFVRDVRAMMDRVSEEKECERLVLGMRVPPSVEECPGLGLDPERWVKEGWVDYLAPSDFMWFDYGTQVETYAAFCKDTDCGVYPCINPFAAEWVDHRAINAYTPNPVNFNRRVFFSNAHVRGLLRNFYTWGADGIYSFNFCCETIDNPSYVKRVHDILQLDQESIWLGDASYFYLPIWRKEQSPSRADQRWRTLRFGVEDIGQRQCFLFRMADGCEGQVLKGRLRFRVYNLHERDVLQIDLNGVVVSQDAIVARRKTNIHVAADTRYQGMHVPPHIAYEIDLMKCPPFCGENALGVTVVSRVGDIDSGCMMEAVEVDVGWDGISQMVGYEVPNNA